MPEVPGFGIREVGASCTPGETRVIGNPLPYFRGDIIIAIDTREQLGEYILGVLEKAGCDALITTLPYSSGCDYFIANVHGSVGIQRKDSMKELVNQMQEIREDIIPRLLTFTDHPVLLVEESHVTGDAGYLFRKENGMYKETRVHCTQYHMFLESVRMMGVEVVCTRGLDQSIWYLAAMDKYLSQEHYPKPMKSYKPHQQQVGMLCCVPGIGAKRAEAALAGRSVYDLVHAKEVDGLTKNQLEKIQKVLRWKE